MTQQEIARALESLIREDGTRPPRVQIQDLIDAGVIDEQGRVLIGDGDEIKQERKSATRNGPSDGPSGRKLAGR
jgi:hypothetical protein